MRRTVSQFHEVVGHMGDQLGGNRFGAFIRFAGQVPRIRQMPSSGSQPGVAFSWSLYHPPAIPASRCGFKLLSKLANSDL